MEQIWGEVGDVDARTRRVIMTGQERLAGGLCDN
jgi:hypothetical protein